MARGATNGSAVSQTSGHFTVQEKKEKKSKKKSKSNSADKSYGKYGILRPTDIYAKQGELCAWLHVCPHASPRLFVILTFHRVYFPRIRTNGARGRDNRFEAFVIRLLFCFIMSMQLVKKPRTCVCDVGCRGNRPFVRPCCATIGVFFSLLFRQPPRRLQEVKGQDPDTIGRAEMKEHFEDYMEVCMGSMNQFRSSLGNLVFNGCKAWVILYCFGCLKN
jgi:hypothetical protein